MSTLKKIKSLERKRTRLLENMLRAVPMLRGNFGSVYCRCGKPSCRCADPKNPGHLSLRITWTEQSRPRTKAIPQKDVLWIQQVTEAYRQFRRQRQEVRKVQEALRVLLNQLEQEVVAKTRKQKDYL